MRQSRSIASGYSDQLVLSLVDDIYAAALDPDLWTGVVKRVVEAVGGATGQLVSPTEHVLTRLWAPHGFDPDVMVPYAQYYHALDVWTIAADSKSMKPCHVFTGEDLLDFDYFKSTEYYNDFLKGFDFERYVGFFVENADQTGRPKTSFSVYRPPGSEPFGANAVKLLDAIAPHVRRAVLLHLRIADLEHERATNTAVFERLVSGIALLDERQRVTYVNPAADLILGANDGLTLVNGELTALAGSETAELCRLVGDAVRITVVPQGSRTGTMTVTRRSKRTPYRLTIIPVPVRGAFTIGRQRTAAIMLIAGETPDRSASIDAFAQAYSLTPSEKRLLNTILGGAILKQAARDLGISVNTAHTQLNSIFSKTGVHRQTDLVRLAMSLTADIRL